MVGGGGGVGGFGGLVGVLIGFGQEGVVGRIVGHGAVGNEGWGLTIGSGGENESRGACRGLGDTAWSRLMGMETSCSNYMSVSFRSEQEHESKCDAGKCRCQKMLVVQSR